ncbi:MAG: hypothetical protein QM220_01080, partial [Atribacterota bacterium]|nr:hypothetical protein [Atribacterota bacterium]
MKISIATITKDFDSLEPINDFLENALKYNHKIYSIIIVYSHNCNFRLVESLREKINVFLLKVNDSPEIIKPLNKIGVSKENIDILLYCNTLKEQNLVPYGINRNYALIQALLDGTEALFFIDTD